VVGPGQAERWRDLDLVVVSPERVHSAEWLGSELASHVAHYGVWLKGAGAWREEVRISRRAIERKVHRLHLKASTHARLFSGSNSRRALKHRAGLRRDLQRLEAMLRDEPVPPTPMLDEAWATTSVPERVQLFNEVSRRVPIGDPDYWRQVILMP
jgi:hypothetical protein